MPEYYPAFFIDRNLLKKQYDVLIGDLQNTMNENKELKTQMVKIAVIDPEARFVRKVDIIKVLKSNAKNEPDLKDFEIAIFNDKINLRVTTLSGLNYEMPLSEAQKYQL